MTEVLKTLDGGHVYTRKRIKGNRLACSQYNANKNLTFLLQLVEKKKTNNALVHLLMLSDLAALFVARIPLNMYILQNSSD